MTTLKRVLLAMLVIVAVSATSWAVTQVSKTLIVGSPHDLTTTSGFNTNSYQVCDFCHVIHKTGLIGSTTGPGYLLWNHKLSAITTYGTYSSETFLALSPTISDLGANNANTTTAALTSSNLCLSCHDGTVAMNSFFVQPSGVATSALYGGSSTNIPSGYIVEDLTKSHPVHFQYTTSLASAAGVLSPTNYPNSVDSADTLPLFGGYLECATCHDPHNYTTSGQYPSNFIQNTLASYTGAGTSMCCYCHI